MTGYPLTPRQGRVIVVMIVCGLSVLAFLPRQSDEWQTAAASSLLCLLSAWVAWSPRALLIRLLVGVLTLASMVPLWSWMLGQGSSVRFDMRAVEKLWESIRALGPLVLPCIVALFIAKRFGWKLSRPLCDDARPRFQFRLITLCTLVVAAAVLLRLAVFMQRNYDEVNFITPNPTMFSLKFMMLTLATSWLIFGWQRFEFRLISATIAICVAYFFCADLYEFQSVALLVSPVPVLATTFLVLRLTGLQFVRPAAAAVENLAMECA